MVVRILVEYPTYWLDGRIFEDAERQVLEIKARQSVQDKVAYSRWRARPSGEPGWMEIDCYVVRTEEGPFGLPASVCRELAPREGAPNGTTPEEGAAPCP